jgi:ubiquinone biosynthesis accessory factor UbiJ
MPNTPTYLLPLEALLNRTIAQSAQARSACQRLDGRLLCVRLEGTPLTLYMKGRGERLTLTATSDGAADATLSGTPLALARMTGEKPDDVVRANAVRFEGDAEVAESFNKLFKLARPDWEEELSRVVGDVAAYQIGKALRGAAQFARRAGRTFEQNISEYLQEESRDVPTRIEADEFADAVDTMRNDVERAAARVARLLARH